MIGYGCVGRTDSGRVRENNEDAFVSTSIPDTPLVLLAAIDGVGGYEGGEVAASITAQTLLSFVLEHRADKPLDLMKKAMVEANNAVCAEKAVRPSLDRMACVASAALVDLDRKQACALAACLPAPLERTPDRSTPFLRKRQAQIYSLIPTLTYPEWAQ